MADIKITCHKCSNVVTVSEFVDENSIACGTCGEKLKKPEIESGKKKPSFQAQKKQMESEIITPAAAETKSSTKPHLKANKEEESSTGESAEEESQLTAWREAYEKNKPVQKVEMTHHIASWILFVILAGAMYYLRYFLTPSPAFSFPDFSMKYAAYIVLLGNIFVVSQAFKDSIFVGILCFIVPFYSLYYLLTVTDNFYMRAVLIGLLVGFIQDSVIVYMEWSGVVFEFVTGWIASGGGDIR